MIILNWIYCKYLSLFSHFIWALSSICNNNFKYLRSAHMKFLSLLTQNKIEQLIASFFSECCKLILNYSVHKGHSHWHECKNCSLLFTHSKQSKNRMWTLQNHSQCGTMGTSHPWRTPYWWLSRSGIMSWACQLLLISNSQPANVHLAAELTWYAFCLCVYCIFPICL